MARDKECTAIITITAGKATSKDVEKQFVNTQGTETWRWTTRPIGENKFIMRFPNAKMIKEWNFFPFIAMRFVDAQMKLSTYSSSFGAKGELQQAWFRVWDIPTDQISIRTYARVGGLVGKVLEIDEKTRLRHEYVRMRIACRDITKVPRTAESTLGLYLKDFHFEREVEIDGSERTLNSGIKVTEGDQPPPHKKYKADDNNGKWLDNKGGQSSSKLNTMGADKEYGKQQKVMITTSAPSKLENRTTVKGDKTYQKHGKGTDEEGKVYIPETFYDSDSNSDFVDKIKSLEGFGDIGQGCSKKNGDGESHQIWCMNTTPNVDITQTICSTKQSQGKACAQEVVEMQVDTGMECHNNPTELDLFEEAIVHTQESAAAEEDHGV